MMSVPSSLTKLVPELGRANVRVSDPSRVEACIRTMMKEAKDKLQVVSDFDNTLTKFSENGKPCTSTHGVLEESSQMADEFKQKARKLKEHYLPIEFDPKRTEKEKIPLMIEWWTSTHQLIVSTGMTRDQLSEIVRESKARMRDGATLLFQTLHQASVPILLFSAGLGDVINETLRQQTGIFDNMKLVSNFLRFDKAGMLAGFQGNNIIHTFNKNEHAIHSSDYFSKLRDRSNLLLLGDHVGDLGMAKGAESVDCLLKVGFLNQEVEGNLPLYMDSFDVVILQDETLDVVNGMVSAILDSPASS